ncbi:MAG: putative metal-binding motif-containing protein [Myxococcales bacterium]|nr:putative metal-binding motif-containing protein [Myxococcales bacterium]
MRVTLLAALSLGALPACNPRPQGAARVVVSFGFRPGCLRVSATDVSSPSRRQEVDLPLEGVKSVGTRTVGVLPGKDWSPFIEVTAVAHLGGCEARPVKRRSERLDLTPRGIQEVLLTLDGSDADGDLYLAGDDDPAFEDCDDSASGAEVHPGAQERCNGLDDDCDGTRDEGLSVAGTYYRDMDRDGFGDPATAVQTCTAPPGHVLTAGDCDDQAARVRPDAGEVCDGADEDCSGAADEPFELGKGCNGCGGTFRCESDGGRYCGGPTTPVWYYPDSDRDGQAAAGAQRVHACQSPGQGYVSSAGDCDDGDPFNLAGGTEICDGYDNDCRAETTEAGVCPQGAAWAVRADAADGGAIWRAAAAYGRGKVWIAGDNGALRVRDGQGPFQSFDGRCIADWRAAWARPNVGRVYLSGISAPLVSMDRTGGGCTEVLSQQTLNADVWALSGTGGNSVELFGAGSELVFRVDPDDPQDLDIWRMPNRNLFAVHAVADRDVWAVGYDSSAKRSLILHYDGSSWSTSAHPSFGGPLRAISMIEPSSGFAAGDEGNVLRWAGAAWVSFPTPYAAVPKNRPKLFAVGAFGVNNVYAASEDGTVWRYTSGWRPLHLDSGGELVDLAGSGPDDLWAIGPRPTGVLHWHEP